MNLFLRTSNSIKRKGLRRTYQSVLSFVEDYYFDLKYRTDTFTVVQLEDLDISKNDKNHSFRYQPTRRRHFRNLMQKLEFPEKCVFVDMGSGKGSVLLMAIQYGFQRVIGVEISNKLCLIARKNIKIYEKKTKQSLPIEVIESDVLRYRFRDDENIFYFFKPFDSLVMKKLMDNIKVSLKKNPREVWLIFNNFRYERLFVEERYFQRKLKHVYGGTEFVVFETNR